MNLYCIITITKCRTLYFGLAPFNDIGTYYLMFKISNFESAFSLSTACHWFWKPRSTPIYTDQSLPLSLRFLSSTLFLCLHNKQLITIFNSNLNVLFGFFTVFFTFMNDFFFSLLLSSFYFSRLSGVVFIFTLYRLSKLRLLQKL